jgi:hypothetical protein
MIRTLLKGLFFLVILLPGIFLWKRSKLLAAGYTAVVLALFLVLVVQASEPSDIDIGNYDYLTGINVTSTSEVSGQWIPIPLPVNQLISNSFIYQSDAQDILPVITTDNAFREIVGQGISDATDPTWWVLAESGDMEANTNTEFALHTGNSTTTHDYPFGFLTEDEIEVCCETYLGLTNSFAFQALTSSAPPTPTLMDETDCRLALTMSGRDATVPTDPLDYCNDNDVSATNSVDWFALGPSFGNWYGRWFNNPADYDEVAYVTVPVDVLKLSNEQDFTIEFWIRSTTFVDTYISRGAANEHNYVIGQGASSDITFEYESGAGVQEQWTSAANVLLDADGNNNLWKHIAVAGTMARLGAGSPVEGQLTFWVDGVDLTAGGSWTAGDGDGDNTGDFDSSALRVGDPTDAALPSTGGYTLSNVRIWDDIRTTAEILAGMPLGFDQTYAVFGENWQGNHSTTVGQGWGLALLNEAGTPRLAWRTSVSELLVNWTPAAATTIDGIILNGSTDRQIFVDGVSVATDVATATTSTSLLATIGRAGDRPVVWGSMLAGSPCNCVLDRVEFRSNETVYDNGTVRLLYNFDPDQVAETQVGVIGNDWTWVGTVSDESGFSNDGTYTLVRPYVADLTVTLTSPSLKTLLVSPTISDLIVDLIGPFDLPTDYSSEGAVAPNFPFADIFQTTATSADMNTSTLWIAFVGIISYLIGLLIIKYTQQPGFGIGLMAAFILVGAAAGLYPPLYVPIAGACYFGLFAWSRIFKLGEA